MTERGDFKDRYARIRKQQILGDDGDEAYEEILKQYHFTRLPDGQVVGLKEKEKEEDKKWDNRFNRTQA